MSLISFFRKISSAVTDWFAGNLSGESATPMPLDQPIPPRKVLLVSFNPRIPSRGGQRLIDVMGWHNPEKLIAAYQTDLLTSSAGAARYLIVERMEIDALPVLEDGFQYDPNQFLALLRAGGGFHQPEGADYQRIVAEFQLVERVAAGEIDEVWMFGPPYAGFYESRMAGRDAFWCNAPPLSRTEPAGRRFMLMGFNYERGVAEMLESFAHRVESIMKYTYRKQHGEENLWERFIRHEKTHPRRAEVGTVHFAPNSLADYDWGNQTLVLSRAYTWHHFPDLSGEARMVNCSEWGDGDARAHKLWWLSHLPHQVGSANGISFQWWQYILDPQRVQ